MKKQRFSDQADFDRALEKECASLSKAIEPKDDLWPGVLEAIENAEPTDTGHTQEHVGGSIIWRLAAGVMLVLTSSLVTAWWMEQSNPENFIATYGPASGNFGMTQALDVNYTDVRSQLITDLNQHLPNLTLETRQIVEQNMRSIEISLAEINVALESDPNNASLQRLLLATYQQELNMLTHMNQLVGTSESIDL